MASLGPIFGGLSLGGFSAGDILYQAGLMLVVLLPLWIILSSVYKRMFFHYVALIFSDQANGLLYRRDHIFEKHIKGDKDRKFWYMTGRKKKIQLMPPEYIIQAKPSIQFPKLRGVISLYEDPHGNFYPVSFIKDQYGQNGLIQPIIAPEPRDWKEAYTQEMMYHAKKLVPKKWYENVVTVGIVTLGVVAIGIAIIMKLAPNLK